MTVLFEYNRLLKKYNYNLYSPEIVQFLKKNNIVDITMVAGEPYWEESHIKNEVLYNRIRVMNGVHVLSLAYKVPVDLYGVS